MDKEIDIQKYEGHTEGPWNADCAEPDAGLIANIDAHDHTVARMVNGCLADTQLIADAPLILEAYNKKCNEAKWLREALQIITKDLDSAIAQGHIPIRATNGIDVTKIRNFAHDASK
jgi:hypothetical protein